MKSAFTHWANLEAARDDSSMNSLNKARPTYAVLSDRIDFTSNTLHIAASNVRAFKNQLGAHLKDLPRRSSEQ